MFPHTIKVGRPPNFTDIVKVFPKAATANVIFAYQDTIYVSDPHVILSPSLVVHECVHLQRQQKIGVKEWWSRYLKDPTFRYEEELLAHAEELRTVLGSTPERMLARARLTVTLQRLRAPLYMFNVPWDRARTDLIRASRMQHVFS